MDAVKDTQVEQEVLSHHEDLLFDGIQESNSKSWNECETKVCAILIMCPFLVSFTEGKTFNDIAFGIGFT